MSKAEAAPTRYITFTEEEQAVINEMQRTLTALVLETRDKFIDCELRHESFQGALEQCCFGLMVHLATEVLDATRFLIEARQARGLPVPDETLAFDDKAALRHALMRVTRLTEGVLKLPERQTTLQ